MLLVKIGLVILAQIALMKTMTKLILGLIVAGVLGFFAWQGALRLGFEPHRLPVVGPYMPTNGQVPMASPSGSENHVDWRVEEVAQGLFVPWSVVFTSPDRILVTERSGTVRVIENGQLNPTPLHTFAEVATGGEEGLMGMALDPNYDRNKYIYFSYAYETDAGMFVKIVRMRDTGTALSDARTILDGIPAASNHAGNRLRFGPDGKLYSTTGDASDRDLAQDTNSLAGKILRINPDGSIPRDNPFSGSYIYSLGHRNPQGIDWQPGTNTMFETEHGPSTFDGPPGGDEVNIIEAGENYGWPLVSHNRSRDGLISPLVVYTPAEAPASGIFYDGDLLPQFKNNFFFGALRGEGLWRLIFNPNAPSEVESQEKLFDGEYGRIRDVAQGPDGAIYFVTSNRDGRGQVRDGDDKLYRIVPN